MGVNQSNEHVSFFCEPGHCFLPYYLSALSAVCPFCSEDQTGSCKWFQPQT